MLMATPCVAGVKGSGVPVGRGKGWLVGGGVVGVRSLVGTAPDGGGGGALDGGEGTLRGGVGTVLAGRVGVGRAGALGVVGVGTGRAGGAGLGASRLGMDGGLPNVGGFARLFWPAGFSFGIPPANSPAN